MNRYVTLKNMGGACLGGRTGLIRRHVKFYLLWSAEMEENLIWRHVFESAELRSGLHGGRDEIFLVTVCGGKRVRTEP